MSTTVCFTAKNICDVIWLEPIDPNTPVEEIRKLTELLKDRLEPYGLRDSVALSSTTTEPLDPAVIEGCLDIDAASELATLLVNLHYDLPAEQVRRFRRSALLDIDPGLLQMWIAVGRYSPARHDLYFTIGETVGTPAARFPPSASAPANAAYTTVAHWWGQRIPFGSMIISEEKRDSFLEYLDLPSRVLPALELALTLGDAAERERKLWAEHGWRIRDSHDFTATPEQYRTYLQQSRGEFSCAKPSCMQLQNAWISDRTICYLASGKPAIVQHTGPSRFLPDAEGLFRFRNLNEAVRVISLVEADYERQCRAARALAEAYFDAEKVIRRVLERAMS